MIVHDRLYGPLNFTDDDLKLFQTPEMTRLRNISLCAIPSSCQPTGVCASRFEHTLGVSHLARIVGKKDEFCEIATNLYFAALIHDIGTPPFSHLGEHFQRQILGKSHEEFAVDIIRNSELASKIEQQGGSIEHITQLVEGKFPPWSDLINGSIDLDNLDNSLRYGLSMGLFSKHYYCPVKIAHLLGFSAGRIYLHLDALNYIPSWEKCRLKVYDFVYSPSNLAPGMMIFRAVDLARRQSEIDSSFFQLTDDQAFTYLEKECNQKTRKLVERARNWKFYERVLSISTSQPSTTFETLVKDPLARGLLADQVSDLLAIPTEDTCVLVGKDRGFKKIHLPIMDDEGATRSLPDSVLIPIYHFQVYLKKDWANDQTIKKIENHFCAI